MICRRVDLSRGRIISGLRCEEVEKNADTKAKRALQTLLHPEMLGRVFQVLALEKDVDGVAPHRWRASSSLGTPAVRSAFEIAWFRVLKNNPPVVSWFCSRAG